MNKKNVIIVGSGVSGLTAAIYLSRANFNVKVFTGYTLGALSDSPLVENFPGFPDGISGYEFLENMQKQAVKFGAVIVDEMIKNISIKDNTVLSDSDETYNYDILIVATGTKPRHIGAKNANKYENNGIHYCATCDGMLYKDKDVCVVGGGNTALTEALYLSDICKTVTLIVRKNKFKADNALVEKINEKKNIIKLMNSEIIECCGDKKINHIILKNNDKTSSYLVDAIFVAIGFDNNDEILVKSLGDNYKEILPDNIKLCGDINNDKHQAVIAAGDGAKIAMEIINKEYIN